MSNKVGGEATAPAPVQAAPSANGRRPLPGYTAADFGFGGLPTRGDQVKVELVSNMSENPAEFLPRMVGDRHTNAAMIQAIADSHAMTRFYFDVDYFVWMHACMSVNIGGRARGETKEVLVATARRNMFRRGFAAMMGRGGGEDYAPDAARGGMR